MAVNPVSLPGGMLLSSPPVTVHHVLRYVAEIPREFEICRNESFDEAMIYSSGMFGYLPCLGVKA